MFLATALICTTMLEPQVCKTIYAQVPPFENKEECEAHAQTIYLAIEHPLVDMYFRSLLNNAEYFIKEVECVQESTSV